MAADKQDLIYAVNESVKDLQSRIDTHCSLVAAVLAADADRIKARQALPYFNLCPSLTREQKLRQAIQEAIEVLEQSRKSFKSKQLESLRKKLTQTLIDME